jgi:hypothetical protein
VEPPTDGPELLADGVDEGGRVVVQARLELRDALGRGRGRTFANLGDDVDGNGSDLDPAFERRELDLEPARQPALAGRE